MQNTDVRIKTNAFYKGFEMIYAKAKENKYLCGYSTPNTNIWIYDDNSKDEYWEALSEGMNAVTKAIDDLCEIKPKSFRELANEIHNNAFIFSQDEHNPVEIDQLRLKILVENFIQYRCE